MTYVEVATKSCVWAVERSAKNRKCSSGGFKAQRVLERESAPTFRQLEDFAAATYTPFGYFFLVSPPEEPLPIPDFRTRRPEGVAAAQR